MSGRCDCGEPAYSGKCRKCREAEFWAAPLRDMSVAELQRIRDGLQASRDAQHDRAIRRREQP